MTKQYILSFLIICTINVLFSQTNNPDRYEINGRGPEFTDKSLLSEGNIYKLSVGETGVYKISYEYLVSTDLQLGSGIKSIQLLTNRGGLIPEDLSFSRYDDLKEIPYIITGNDESFDAGEFIIFYVEGADTYKILDNEMIFEKNIYDKNNFIFLRQHNQNRIQFSKSNVSLSPLIEIDSYLKHQRYEEDKTNLLGQYTSTQGSGKIWYGDYFNITSERTYNQYFNFQNILQNSPLHVTVGFAGRGNSSQKLILDINNSNSEYGISSVNTDNLESRYASHITAEKIIQVSDENVQIKLDYPNVNENEGWLDYIETKSIHKLVLGNTPLSFIPHEDLNGEAADVSILGEGPHVVWDVTDPLNMTEHETKTEQGKIVFSIQLDRLRRYVVFNPVNVVNTPQDIVKIDNQNLHALNELNLLIIYHPDFEEEAKTLADFRSSQGILTASVPVNKIYNEFGGGKKDPVAIRDFAKMIFDKSANFKYLLLLGDGSYDYRNLTPGLEDQNFIPVYETDESLHPIESFPSDDFYALLSDNDGADLRGQLEIAVGRIPVKTKKEAQTVVNKLIRYDSDPKTLGDWRLNIGFTADDEDFNTHLNQSERIARDTENKFPVYNQQKVYFDAFQQVATSGGARYPEASAK